MRFVVNIKYISMKNLKKLKKAELKTIVGGADCTRLCFINDKLTCVPYSSCGGPGLEP
jgi:hypothetical protein